jgi:hypothetical protein
MAVAASQDAEASVADAVARLITLYSLAGSGDQNRRRPMTGEADYEAAERFFGPDMRLKNAGIDLRLTSRPSSS